MLHVLHHAEAISAIWNKASWEGLVPKQEKPVSVDQKCKKKKIEKFAQGLLVFFSTATTTYVNKSRNRKLKKLHLA